jgi:hypothetical protein
MSAVFVDNLAKVIQRRIPVFIVRGTGDPGFDDFDEGMTGRLGEIVKSARSLLDVEILDGRVGAFADGDLQRPVIDSIVSWTKTLDRIEPNGSQRRAWERIDADA